MNKYLLAIVLLLSSCSSYQPLYGELGGKTREIDLKDVYMKETQTEVGERRLAQQLYYRLSRIFVDSAESNYDLYVELAPSESAIATRSDDTDKRKSISVTATMILKDKQDKQVFKTSFSRSSTYTTQDEPFATQAAREKALQSIVSSLSGDIMQRAALWFRGVEIREDIQ